VVVDSLKALDLERPIREAEVVGALSHFRVGPILLQNYFEHPDAKD
jgi:hypothetical protein